MRRYAFVAQMVALLIGFYVMCAALLAGLAALTVVASRISAQGTMVLLVITLSAVFVVIRGVFVSTRLRGRDIAGVEVRPAEQPALWQHVRQLAAQVGTRAPRRLYLVTDANAAVWENCRLLGLIPGKRQMMVGMPLLMALTPAQLDAILAHELGHFGNRDTQLGGLVGRARQSALSAARAATTRKGRFQLPGATLFTELFGSYARLVLRRTQEASRQQEYAADRVAARIAGPANTIAALQQIRGISAAFGFYFASYVSPGIELGLLPPPHEVLGGFTGLLADPARQAELAKLRARPESEPPDPFDSHPPMTERIAALRALPDDGPRAQHSASRAISIVANPGHVLAAVARRAMRRQTAGRQVTSWDGLAQATGLHRAGKRAEPLHRAVAQVLGQPADLAALTDLVGAGRLDEVLAVLPQGEAARRARATGRVAREHAKTELAPMLTAWLACHLARAGQVAWRHSWADVEGDLVMAPALRAELNAAVADVVAVRPDGSRMRALVTRTAVRA